MEALAQDHCVVFEDGQSRRVVNQFLEDCGAEEAVWPREVPGVEPAQSLVVQVSFQMLSGHGGRHQFLTFAHQNPLQRGGLGLFQELQNTFESVSIQLLGVPLING